MWHTVHYTAIVYYNSAPCGHVSTFPTLSHARLGAHFCSSPSITPRSWVRCLPNAHHRWNAPGFLMYFQCKDMQDDRVMLPSVHLTWDHNQTCNFHNLFKGSCCIVSIECIEDGAATYFWWKTMLHLNALLVLNQLPVNLTKLRGLHFCLCQGHWWDVSCANLVALKEIDVLLVFKQGYYYSFKSPKMFGII